MGQRDDVLDALKARLATVVGIPPAAHRQYEDGSYTPSGDTAYLECRMRDGERRRLTMPAQGAFVQQDGTWSLMYHVKIGTSAAADEVVEAILAAFAPGTRFDTPSGVVVIDSSRRWGGGRDIRPSRWTVPIDIRWHLHFTNVVS